MRLRADDHTPVTSKVEVGGGFAEVDLSDKKTMWVEDMNTIAYARVNIPIGVGMNTYHLVSGIVRKKKYVKLRTVSGTNVDIGEDLLVLPGTIVLYVPTVTGD